MQTATFNTTKFAFPTDLSGEVRMKFRAIVERSMVLVLVAALVCSACGQATQKVSSDQAAQALRHYIHLRLQDAEWKEYSQFITWPDEPGWDCKWVVTKYDVGLPVMHKAAVRIPVVYSRLGLFCYDFDFKPDPKMVAITYELVRHQTGWKVNSPIPDYPEIGGDTLMKSLNALAANLKESADRRAQAAATAVRINEAMEHGPATLPTPAKKY